MDRLKPAFLKYRAVQSSYWKLIKSLQTILLLTTGIAGFLSVHPAQATTQAILALAGSLFMAISGSTVLNMWLDRDIDAMMKRTCNRPLVTQSIPPRNALVFGSILSTLGITWAMILSPIYGALVFAGLFVNIFIYTLWLKRRSPWSIILGGISGGIPVLAGRALALGRIDWIGVLLLLAVLFWIPTHILTFSMKYQEDYQAARVPTIAARYGFHATRVIIGVSSILAAIAMGSAALGVGTSAGALRLIIVLSTGLLILALTSIARPSERLNFSLFKYASFYMLGAMLLLIIR
jgi:protoheme IX farnesyltransferase